MASTGVRRKLTAIMAADAAGYSRLMGENEAATLRTLTEFRRVFSELIERFRGRVVNAPGDSILSEFASVVDAVDCGAEIQRELAERNLELVERRRMAFRIGINLGDVMVRGRELYGDGVNVAARLESLAEPGGICVSRAVYDQVKQKLKLHFEYMGEREVKNIAEPLRAYRVLTGPEDAAQRAVRAGQADGKAPPPLPLPDKPSVAVLAFANMSGDPEQEYFGDGLAEDIITDLSKVSGLFVIARNSSFSYKGRNVPVGQVGREMGVRFVLEGSVRKAGDRVRITAQLVEADSGNHLWAERYDRRLEDVFQVQDEITNEIVTALDVKLVEGEQARIWRKSLTTPVARDLYYRGRQFFYRLSREAQGEARALFAQVAAAEPESPLGYVYEALSNWYDAFRGWSQAPRRIPGACRAIEPTSVGQG